MAILIYIYIYILSFSFLGPSCVQKKISTLGPSCAPSFFLGHASWACHLFSFFIYSPCLIWRILEREIFKHGVYFAGSWNGIANFECRSLAGGVHMILIKQVWKDISLGSQSVRYVSWRSTYGFGRTNTWSCKAMEVFPFDKKFPRHISR